MISAKTIISYNNIIVYTSYYNISNRLNVVVSWPKYCNNIIFYTDTSISTNKCHVVHCAFYVRKLYDARSRAYYIHKYLFVCLFFNRYTLRASYLKIMSNVYMSETEASLWFIIKTIYFSSTFSEL